MTPPDATNFAAVLAAPRPPLTGTAPPDRLLVMTCLYLVLPGVVFLGGWAQPVAAALAGGAAAAALALLPGWRGPWPLGWRATLLCLALGLAWAASSGAAHLFYATDDWQVRDAVLRDLSLLPWPVAYDEGEVSLLRAPLGFFMPPALVGQALGRGAAQAALWAWTGLGLALVLLLLATLARSLRVPAVGVGLVFVLFGGLDILPNLVLDGMAGAGVLASWGRGGEWWARAFQYSGHVTAVLWAPNHAMPAWLGALLLLRHARTGAFAAVAALPIGAGAFWSPVGAAGAAVLVAVAVLAFGRWRDALRGPVNWLALAFAAPLCLYLTAGAEKVPAGFLLTMREDGWWRWPLFVAVEVLPWAVPAWLVLRGRMIPLAAAWLCVLPLLVFGAGNEAASRGSQAALAVLAVLGAAAVFRAPPGGRRLALRVVAVLAVAGSLTEASLLLTRRPWTPSERCTVPEAARQSVFRDVTDWSHYLAPWPDARLEPWLRPPHPRPIPERSLPCWPGGP